MNVKGDQGREENGGVERQEGQRRQKKERKDSIGLNEMKMRGVYIIQLKA